MLFRSGSRHSRVTVIVAVARLATALNLYCILIAVARLATAMSLRRHMLALPELILTGTRMPRWMTLSTRVPLFASLTATTTLVATLSLSTLCCRLFACLLRVIHLHLLVLSRPFLGFFCLLILQKFLPGTSLHPGQLMAAQAHGGGQAGNRYENAVQVQGGGRAGNRYDDGNSTMARAGYQVNPQGMAHRIGAHMLDPDDQRLRQIGRASCRERV